MKMGHGACCLALLLTAHFRAEAGSVDNRNNSSAQFIRTLSRNAAVDGGDLAIYNPAGAAQLPEGLVIDVSNQTVYKFNEHFLQGPKVAYNSELVSPFYPSAFAVYRRGSWAGFTAFHFPAGGGDLHYDGGSAAVFPLATNLSAMNPPREADVKLRSLYYAFTLGGTYALNDKVSFALAVRPLYARTDITVDAGVSLPPRNTSKLLDHLEEARGVGGIAGVDAFPMPGLVLALRFESATPLEWEVQRSTLNIDNVLKDPALRAGYIANLRQQIRAEGQKFNRDLPANLGLGAAYQLMPDLRADLSFNYYFNSLAGWDGLEDKFDDGWEVSLAGTYDWRGLRASLGGLYTVTGADPDTYQTENPALNSWSLAGGGQYALGHGAAVNLGVTGNFALADDNNIASLGKADLRKQVWIYALGLQYHAF